MSKYAVPIPYRLMLVISAATSLSACISVGVNPLPVGEGVQILNSQCPPRSNAVARFERQGVFVAVLMDRMGTNGISFRMTFEVPAGKTVSLQDHYVSIVEHPGARAHLWPDSYEEQQVPLVGRSIPDEEIASQGWMTLHQPVEGSAGELVGMSKATSKIFYFLGSSAQAVTAEATLRLPRFLVNGIADSPITVRFVNKMTANLMPLNC